MTGRGKRAAFVSCSQQTPSHGRTLGNLRGCELRFSGMRTREARRQAPGIAGRPRNSRGHESAAWHYPRKHHHRRPEREWPESRRTAPHRRSEPGSECTMHSVRSARKSSRRTSQCSVALSKAEQFAAGIPSNASCPHQPLTKQRRTTTFSGQAVSATSAPRAGDPCPLYSSSPRVVPVEQSNRVRARHPSSRGQKSPYPQ